jgi:glycosyltransferase involved in cell wall biosynthesis
MLTIARHLQLQGIEVRMCFKLVDGPAVAPTFEQVLASSGVDYVFAARVASCPFLAVLRWADVLHVHTPSPDIVAFGRVLRRPTVVTVYNHKPAERSRVAKSRVAMSLSARVWFISDFVADTWDIVQAPPRYEKAPTVADLPIGEVPPGQRSGFVSIARLIENKGLDDLVIAYGRAHIRHADHPLTVIGEGPLQPKLVGTFRSPGSSRPMRGTKPSARHDGWSLLRTPRRILA